MPPWLGVALTGVLALVISLFVGMTRSFFVPSDSMTPTLVRGDQLSTETFFAPQKGPKRGEIWVLNNPTPEDGADPVLVKRVMGLPGEKVGVKGGKLTVNGKVIEEPYCAELMAEKWEPVKLGPDQYWVLGDNRNNSGDSTEFGPVAKSALIGRAFVRYWPPSRFKWF